jgi:hypothetical protein
MKHTLTLVRERRALRRTLVHEFGHAVIAHCYGASLARIRVCWETRAIAFPNLSDAIAAAPLRDWRSIYITIALAGVLAEQMITIAQPSPASVVQDLTTQARHKEDGLMIERAFGATFSAGNVATLVGNAKALLVPRIHRMVEVAERQAEVHVWGPERAYNLDGAALMAALVGGNSAVVPPQYDPPRYRWAT